MRDYSLDNNAEKITVSKTKEYFQEVIKSYYIDNFRSAVVMLYSVSIIDLLYKLEELKDIYNDSNAIQILADISIMQTKNPNSPDWETKLIEMIKDRTNLLEPSDFLNLQTLQKHRHLCAHPILTKTFELYNPNKETTRAHIRNMLEGLLTKPALLSRKVFEDFLADLSKIKTIIFDDIQLEKHLSTKYLSKLNNSTLVGIFKSLWKITFKISNRECDDNRDINYRALLIVVNHKYPEVLQAVTSQKDYYSDLNENFLVYGIQLFNRFPAIYEELNDSTKILVGNLISQEADLDTYAIFLSKDIVQHISKVINISWQSNYQKKYITTESILIVYNYAINEGHRNLANDFIITMFGKSDQYDTADNRFENLIEPHLITFTKEELVKLVKVIDDNSQIHDRRKASASNRLIREKLDLLSENEFDYSKYTHFSRRY